MELHNAFNLFLLMERYMCEKCALKSCEPSQTVCCAQVFLKRLEDTPPKLSKEKTPKEA